MKQDRLLIVLLVVILLLVLASIGVFFGRQQAQSYIANDTPAGVVHDYILALMNRDYEKAYSYLKDDQNKPTYESFRQFFLMRQVDPSSATTQFGETSQMGEEAWVELHISQGGKGLFGRVYTSTGSALLERNSDGEWKLVSLLHPYWNWDWFQQAPVEIDRPPQ